MALGSSMRVEKRQKGGMEMRQLDYGKLGSKNGILSLKTEGQHIVSSHLVHDMPSLPLLVQQKKNVEPH